MKAFYWTVGAGIVMNIIVFVHEVGGDLFGTDFRKKEEIYEPKSIHSVNSSLLL